MFGDTARLTLGTPTGDPDQLYRPVIAVYDKMANWKSNPESDFVGSRSLHPTAMSGAAPIDMVEELDFEDEDPLAIQSCLGPYALKQQR
ncbi:hypothetical protein F5Y17DRAFT_457979 [Xylariaceae sp. FL0594]|nr:hypothetical protein F5Y17DRAFT_457979 [Xylariaceae sp. FL0594]